MVSYDISLYFQAAGFQSNLNQIPWVELHSLACAATLINMHLNAFSAQMQMYSYLYNCSRFPSRLQDVV